MRKKDWYKLDTAAKVYPVTLSATHQANVFRLSCTLTEQVDQEILQTALYVTLQRYPSFNIRLKRGVFWYYFEKNKAMPQVSEERLYPCQWIDPSANHDFLFRISTYQRRINLEFFHALTDGGGAIEFFKTLLYTYFAIMGKAIDPQGLIRTLGEAISAEEIENSFLRYYDPIYSGTREEEPAYHYNPQRLPPMHSRIIHGEISAQKFLRLTHSYGVSVTEFLTAVLIQTFFLIESNPVDENQMVKVSVPLNLRKLFPSSTVRNFSFYMNVGEQFKNRNVGFDTLLRVVSTQLRTMNQKEKLIPRMNPNVDAEQNPLLQWVPLDIKSAAIRTVACAVGDQLFTCGLSNIGVIDLPQAMHSLIEYFDFALSTTDKTPLNCSICTFGDRLRITFVSAACEKIMEQTFFRLLVAHGLDICIQEGENGADL